MTFDQPLQAGVTVTTNWVYTSAATGELANGPHGTIAGDTVAIVRGNGGGPPDPPSRCHYFAAPADVKNVAGIPAAAFSDFPVTVLP